MKILFCFIGLHKFVYQEEQKHRECLRCKRKEAYLFDCEGEGAGNFGHKYFTWKLIK